MLKLWRRLCCALGRHKVLLRIARVSPQADHVGCPYCRREFGINHDVRAVLDWDEVRSLYLRRGYDDRAAARATFAAWEQRSA